MLCGILESQKENILTAEDVEGPTLGFITISPKLMQGTYVADTPLATVDAGGALGSNTNGTAQLLRDKIHYLEGVIQSSLAKKSVLEARLRSLSGEDDPKVDPSIGDSGVEVPRPDILPCFGYIFGTNSGRCPDGEPYGGAFY
ncbi:hypothetical protein LIER_42830 [Lithospermum erythrorhizon]|uniref:Uncharacterized protein n=1 Tax=Lithospermum erythrorhizon TaxID=34254 RepID=A0AAV3P1P0_LITER